MASINREQLRYLDESLKQEKLRFGRANDIIRDGIVVQDESVVMIMMRLLVSMRSKIKFEIE